MRFISERWLLGPVVALVALYLCVTCAVENAVLRTEKMAGATITKVYQLASQGKFDELATSGLVSADDVRYLKMQDACFGRVQKWNLDNVQSKPLGRGWSAFVRVTRKRTDLVDILNGANPHSAKVRPSFEVNMLTAGHYYDMESSDEMTESSVEAINLVPDSTFESALPSAKSALEIAKPLLWRQGNPKSATAERVGDYWLVTAKFISDSQSDENGERGKMVKTSYLVLTAGGTAIELVDSKDPSVRLAAKK